MTERTKVWRRGDVIVVVDVQMMMEWKGREREVKVTSLLFWGWGSGMIKERIIEDFGFPGCVVDAQTQGTQSISPPQRAQWIR